jgi:Toprim-like
MDDYSRFYQTYLYDSLYGSGKNRTTTCPFCESVGKFAININTSEAQCLKADCGERVNHITFLTKYHQAWLSCTEEDSYEDLSNQRGISPSTFRAAKWAYDSYNDRWLVPYKNPFTPNLTNLGHFQTKGKHAFRIYKAPNVNDEMPLTLYNPYTLHKGIKTDTCYITEGEWDALALMELFSDTNEVIIGVPGALIFPEAAKKWFEKINHVNLVYDYDDAGAMGTRKAYELLSRWGKQVRAIDWTSADGAEAGMDIRDMLMKHRTTAAVSIRSAMANFESSEEAEQELSAGYVRSMADIAEVDNFDNYIDMYGKHLHLSQENIDSMAITMAIATSQYLPGEPLWFFLVGQPGSGKTTLIESFGGNNEYFDYASRVTSKSLVSGWNSGPEASLITKMNGKTFFIKDFTVVLGMPKEQKKEVFNLFRDIYDGTLKITFGNGKVVDLSNLRFNMIAGVTDAIKSQSDASMGERFLRYDYMGTDWNDELIIDSALSGFGRFNERKDQLTEASLGFVKTILKPENRWDLYSLPRLSQGSRNRLSALARYTAYIRTRPETDRTDGLVYRPRKEIASRLALQYAKLSFALEKVFSPGMKVKGDLEISERTFKLIAKVAHDTAEGFAQDIVKIVYDRPNIGRKDLEVKLKLTSNRVHRVITDLKTLGLIQIRTTPNVRPTRQGYGKVGRPTEQYCVHPDFASLLKDVLGNEHGE